MFRGRNNQTITLTAQANPADTTISVSTTDGAAIRAELYPAHSTNQRRAVVPVTFGDSPTDEIMYCTDVNVANDTITVQRNREGTSAATWTNGSVGKVLLTAGGFNYLASHGAAEQHLIRHDNASGSLSIDFDEGLAHWIEADGDLTISFANILKDSGKVTNLQRLFLWLHCGAVSSSFITWDAISPIWEQGSGELDTINDTNSAQYLVEFYFMQNTYPLASWRKFEDNPYGY